MGERYFETVVGAVILTVTIIAMIIVGKFVQVDTANTGSYFLTAEFSNIDGIVTGTPVKIAGITVGNVSKTELNLNKMSASVVIRIAKADLELPKDTSVRITSSGLLGAKYLDLQPGSDDKTLQNRDRIRYTQSTVNLEDIISRVVTSGGNRK